MGRIESIVSAATPRTDDPGRHCTADTKSSYSLRSHSVIGTTIVSDYEASDDMSKDIVAATLVAYESEEAAVATWRTATKSYMDTVYCGP